MEFCQRNKGSMLMKQNPKTRICPVCDETLTYEKIYEYTECPACNSYIYISDKTAENDNQSYFNSWFDLNEYSRSDFIKKKIYKIFSKKDRKTNQGDYQKLACLKKEIALTFQKDRKVLEVGFGEGKHLLKLLESGCDAYGIDISEQAVSNFKKHHPQFADQVKVGTRFDLKMEIIYCSALLEHLDTPQVYIDDISSSLTTGGLAIVDAVPIVNETNSSINLSDDISFWKPCHRIIFSHKGIEQMFAKKGYILKSFAFAETYIYKLLSLHIKYNYNNITQLRNPCIKNDKLPGLYKFYALCREAINLHSKALVGTYIFCKE